ncbi:hypothetical protein B0H14DRAFT_262065 [Mycena olivaceomarginata]|nr:hypothetical protein B0H14DRAFT_262065 [Mycena olivaceomarginata]
MARGPGFYVFRGLRAVFYLPPHLCLSLALPLARRGGLPHQRMPILIALVCLRGRGSRVWGCDRGQRSKMRVFRAAHNLRSGRATLLHLHDSTPLNLLVCCWPCKGRRTAAQWQPFQQQPFLRCTTVSTHIRRRPDRAQMYSCSRSCIDATQWCRRPFHPMHAKGRDAVPPCPSIRCVSPPCRLQYMGTHCPQSLKVPGAQRSNG